MQSSKADTAKREGAKPFDVSFLFVLIFNYFISLFIIIMISCYLFLSLSLSFSLSLSISLSLCIYVHKLCRRLANQFLHNHKVISMIFRTCYLYIYIYIYIQKTHLYLAAGVWTNPRVQTEVVFLMSFMVLRNYLGCVALISQTLKTTN